MFRSLIALAIALSVASTSRADLVDPSVPTWRGEAGSLYYQWDSFTEPFAQPNFPTTPPFDFSAQVFNFVGGAQLIDGDRLGFFYTAPAAGHMLIFYGEIADGPQLTRLFPAEGPPGSAPVQAGKAVPVPDGAVVGPGAGCEWVVGLFSEAPIDEAAAQKAVIRWLEQREPTAAKCHVEPGELDGVSARIFGVTR